MYRAMFLAFSAGVLALAAAVSYDRLGFAPGPVVIACVSGLAFGVAIASVPRPEPATFATLAAPPIDRAAANFAEIETLGSVVDQVLEDLDTLERESNHQFAVSRTTEEHIWKIVQQVVRNLDELLGICNTLGRRIDAAGQLDEARHRGMMAVTEHHSGQLEALKEAIENLGEIVDRAVAGPVAVATPFVGETVLFTDPAGIVWPAKVTNVADADDDRSAADLFVFKPHGAYATAIRPAVDDAADPQPLTYRPIV